MAVINKFLTVSTMCVSAFLVQGCAPKLGGSDYSVQGAGEISETLKGVIVSSRVVNISAKSAKDQNNPGMGALGGGLLGAVGGASIGQGRGSLAAAGVGAVAGAVAGHVLEDKITSQEGFEYQVRLEDGRLISITQGADPVLRVGQRVLVIKGTKDRSRVVPDMGA